jgi:hypothetical protein
MGAIKNAKGSHQDEMAYFRCVQEGDVMLVQQSRGWTQVNPDWFPAKNRANQTCGIYFGNQLDRIVEKEGWIFVEHGDAYLAVRVVMGEYSEGWKILQDDASPGMTSELIKDSYDWSSDREIIYLKDNFAGMIFETSRRKHYQNLELFMGDVLDNFLVLDKTVVPGFHILRYKGCGDKAEEIYFNLANNEIPMVGGERIDYTPDRVFNSPYLKSSYNSGVVEISKDNMKLVLDFNQ